MGGHRATQPTQAPAAVAPLTMSDEQIRQLVLDHLRDIPDFPKPGVLFKDFTPLLADGDALRAVADHLAQRYAGDRKSVV